MYSFPNGLTRPWAFLPMGFCVPFSLGHPWPICLPWAYLALLTNFVFPWAFTDFIGLPRPNYFILILGVHGPAIIPLLSLLVLLWAYHGPFLLFSRHTLPMGLLLTISLFPSASEPISFLKVHLLTPWTCDLLFLPLGLNGFLFSVSWQIPCVAELGFHSYVWVFSKKDPQQTVILKVNSNRKMIFFLFLVFSFQ